MTAIPIGCPAKLEMNFNWSDLVVGLAVAAKTWLLPVLKYEYLWFVCEFFERFNGKL